jgi:hypothetical protein
LEYGAKSMEMVTATIAPAKVPLVDHPMSAQSKWRVERKEELGDFEQCAECACAHGSSKRSPKRKGLKLEFET